MKLLLLADTGTVPASYLAKLRSWGIEYILAAHHFSQAKQETELDFMDRITDTARAKYGDTIDFVQVFFDRKTWPLASGIKGKQYYSFVNDYQLAFVRLQKEGTAGTAEHELFHSFDNFCRAYTGVELARIVGVQDWDRDIVHRRDPKTGKYRDQYDDIFPIVQSYVEAAIAERKRLLTLKGLQALLAKLLSELKKLQLAGKDPEELPDDQETPVERPEEPVPPIPAPTPTPPTKTPAQRLYDAAKRSLGKDMSNRAPNALGCADALNNVHEVAFGYEIGGGTSTYELNRAMRKSPRFVEITKAEPYAVIMCSTGESTKGAKNGHVGIIGEKYAPDGSLYVMSNDSFKGTWEANYSVTSWRKYFGTKLGFPVHIYRLVDG